MWKAGHSLIKSKMKEEKAPLAGPPPGVLQHRAVLETPDGRPFSLVVETYTAQALEP